MTQPRVLADGFAMLESARWHDGRLWAAHWAASEIIAVDLDGLVERIGGAPAGYGWSVDWLPDGRRLTTGPDLTVSISDGTSEVYGHLADLAPHGWNEIAVTAGDDVYVNGFSFDAAGGGAPGPGVIALVRPDGSSRIVAGDLQFPNGMLTTPDGRSLLVSESFAGRITAFDIGHDGGLDNRRTWAEGVAPDGICLDAEGGVWCGAADIRMMGAGPDAPGGALQRVLEGGEITQRVEFDRPAFSCALGGRDGRTLFALTNEFHGFDRLDATAAQRTARIVAIDVVVPAA
jgi:sugar lactone lactonase YvrE